MTLYTTSRRKKRLYNFYRNIPLRVKKNSMDKPAPTGSVTTQETIILPTTEKSTADNPLAKPTPNTAPTSV